MKKKIQNLDDKLKNLTDSYFSGFSIVDYSYGWDDSISDVSVYVKKDFDIAKIAHGKHSPYAKTHKCGVYIAGEDDDLIAESGFSDAIIEVYEESLLPLAKDFCKDYVDMSGMKAKIVKEYE